jgi:hypothetical protein
MVAGLVGNFGSGIRTSIQKIKDLRLTSVALDNGPTAGPVEARGKSESQSKKSRLGRLFALSTNGFLRNKIF